MPVLSIIIPCYNSSFYIKETLDSVRKQTFCDWECIIVNDGSTDNSLDIIKEYYIKDKRFKYIDKKNEGPAIARNIAIQNSTGEFILPLDSDDIIEPTYTEKAIQHFRLYPKTKLVYCQAELFGNKNGKWDLPNYSYSNLIWANCIFCAAIYRREDYDKTKGYNPNMNMVEEDWDFYLSLLNINDLVYQIPEILFYYRQHEKSRTNLEPQVLIASRLQLILNHPDIYQKDIQDTAIWLLKTCGIQEDILKLNKKLEYTSNELYKITHSKSFKIGRAITFPLRIIKKIRHLCRLQ